MMYPYMTLSDETEITHSQTFDENGVKSVEVHFERATDNGFDTARFSLPSYRILLREGQYTDEEIEKFKTFLRNNAHLIYEFAENGGIFSTRSV